MTDSAVSEPTVDPAPIENLMQVMLKGLRAIQLYLPNNPVYQQAVQNVRAAFAPVWEELDALPLSVTETEFLWEGRPVLSQETKNESVAWLLHKDGIRALTLSPGVEEEEVVRFLSVVQKVRTLPPEAEDDLLTLLWEEDFQHVHYSFVELGEDVPPLERDEDKPPPDPEAVKREVVRETEPPQGIVSLEDFDPTLYFLDESEIEYLQGEFQREYKQDLRSNVLGILFDLLELQTYTTVRTEVVSIVENFLPYLLAVGDFRSVAYVLRELRVILDRARELSPEHKDAIESLPAKLSQPESLSQLLQSLDEALVFPTEDELGELFREFRADALATIVTWLPKLTNERVREILDGAAQRLAQAHPEEVVKALQHDDDAAVLETVRMVSRLKLPPVVPALGDLLAHPDQELRHTTAEALATIGTPGAMQQLEKAIDDSDREVRMIAVRTLGSKGHRGAFPKVEAAVMGRSLRGADLSEKMAVFEAYGLLAGAAGVEHLAPMLLGKGFMKRKEDPETRACAAMALGKIATPDVKEILQNAQSDKEPLVRNAINKALRELR